jgi:hypothetical protein
MSMSMSGVCVEVEGRRLDSIATIVSLFELLGGSNSNGRCRIADSESASLPNSGV